MPKITFVYPDFESLGIEYLMAVCLEGGLNVDFVYYQAEDTYFGSKISNISFHQIAERVVATRPDVVAFSCVTDNYQFQLQCAKALKRIVPHVITVFGGVHPTAVPGKVLLNPEVDCVAIGEAEQSLPAFLKEVVIGNPPTLPETPIDGMAYKKGDKVIGSFKEGAPSDLDILPFPYKKPFFTALKDAQHEYRIITSRGCPYSCSYCFNSYAHKLGGRRYIRRRSIDNVIDELTLAKAQYNLKYLLFLDDSFTTDRAWILAFCDRYKQKIDLPFACIANPNYIDKKIAEVLSGAGCINIQIGIQSLSEELCASILQRKSSNAKIAQAICELKRAGIMVQVDHMLGIPGDTPRLQEESIFFYNKYRPSLINIFWLTYYPKTSIVEIAKQRGILNEKDVTLIEEGRRLTDGSYLAGGSMKNPKPYYSIALLLNYLPILPKWLVNFLVYGRLYRFLSIKNFFIATALPRVIQSIFNRKDFRGRSHLIRFIDKKLVKKLQFLKS